MHSLRYPRGAIFPETEIFVNTRSIPTITKQWMAVILILTMLLGAGVAAVAGDNQSQKDSRPYPSTPEGVLHAFINAALGDVPITPQEMRLDFDILSVQNPYFFGGEDVEANEKIQIVDDDERSEFSLGKYNIMTGFEIKEVKKEGKVAAVKILYKRLGWVWDHPVHIRECRNLQPAKKEEQLKAHHLSSEQIRTYGQQKRSQWDEEGCRFLRITNDTQEVNYGLAKPGRFWRIIGSYEPYVSVSSAIKILQWEITEVAQGVSRVEPSERQKAQLGQDISVLQSCMGE
jgi:hypothetical protein